jgi:hypothetical protein
MLGEGLLIQRHSTTPEFTPLKHSSENLKSRDILRLGQEAREGKVSAQEGSTASVRNKNKRNTNCFYTRSTDLILHLV